jgi:hypothetical protein
MKEAAEGRMDSQASEMNARLEKLERENRRMKKIGFVTVVFASVLFISGQAKSNKVVEANAFRVVDATGKVVGTFAANDEGRSFLMLTDSTGRLLASLQGSTLSLGSVDTNTLIRLVSVPSFTSRGLHMAGSAGKFDVTLDEDSGGPNMTIEDNKGYSSVLGRSDLVLTKRRKKEQTPAASVVLFNKDKKVLWSAP